MWIIISGLVMSTIALVGSITLLLPNKLFKRVVLPLVSLAGGTLIGGAIFHLLPEAVSKLGNTQIIYLLLAIGFITFFILEQFLHWHHCHQSLLRHQPVSYLILLADGLHNFIGGLAVGSAFIIDTKLGIITWIVAAAHEIPQELGDFGILIHSGWKRSTALIFNVISALTFPIGALFVYAISSNINTAALLPFAAGNFLYIGAADLIPQLKSDKLSDQISQFLFFIVGLFFMFMLVKH